MTSSLPSQNAVQNERGAALSQRRRTNPGAARGEARACYLSIPSLPFFPFQELQPPRNSTYDVDMTHLQAMGRRGSGLPCSFRLATGRTELLSCKAAVTASSSSIAGSRRGKKRGERERCEENGREKNYHRRRRPPQSNLKPRKEEEEEMKENEGRMRCFGESEPKFRRRASLIKR